MIHKLVSTPSKRAAARTARPGLERLEELILLSADVRSYDGTGNNIAHSDWGAANTQLLRNTTIAYTDGYASPAGADRPNPRTVSNLVSSQTGSIPNDRHLTEFLFQWGQFVDHDLDLTENAVPEEPFNINVPAGDPNFPDGTQIPVLRALYDTNTGTGPGNPRQQVNEITSFLDGSNVYGSDAARADALRTHVGGLLRSQQTSVGELLPFNTTGLPNAQPFPGDFFVAGDIRSNEQPGLTALHTLFLREHNRLSQQIAADQFHNRNLSDPRVDEAIYQQARQIVIAEIEVITYYEFLPALFGPDGVPSYDGYDRRVDPAVATVFSAGLYRIGHTMLPDELTRLGNNGNPVAPPVSLGDAFFQVGLTTSGGIEPFLKGLSANLSQEIDAKVVDGVRNQLFDPPAGDDLVATNLQRGRDVGLPDLNTLRKDFGLRPYTSFSQITTDAATAAELRTAYNGKINQIDPWIGAVSETHLPGSSVGETMQAVLVDQFARTRDGDRFYFENVLHGQQLYDVLNTRLADVIRRNTTLSNVPEEIFRDQTVLTYRAPAGTGAANVTVRVWHGQVQVVSDRNGAVLASQSLASTSTVVVFGTDRDDQITVDLRGAALGLPVEVHGGAGRDTLVIRSDDGVTVEPTAIYAGTTDVYYGDVERVVVQSHRPHHPHHPFFVAEGVVRTSGGASDSNAQRAAGGSASSGGTGDLQGFANRLILRVVADDQKSARDGDEQEVRSSSGDSGKSSADTTVTPAGNRIRRRVIDVFFTSDAGSYD